MSNEGPIQIIITSATVLAAIGYLITAFVHGTKKKFEKLSDKLDEKQDKSVCKEFRDQEDKRMTRTEDDLREHREANR